MSSAPTSLCLVEVSADPLAELVPQLDRVPDRGRDVVAVPDIQGQARAGEAETELIPPQERGQSARAGHQGDRLADDGPLEGLAAEQVRGRQQDLQHLGGTRVRDGGVRGGLGGVTGSGRVKGAGGEGVQRPWPWPWPWSWTHSRTRSSRTAGFTSPNTTGVIDASHANPSAASPSSQAAPSLPTTDAAARCPAHSPRTRSVHCCCNAESASRTIRSASEICAQTRAGWPARSGSRPALTSRRMASSSAS